MKKFLPLLFSSLALFATLPAGKTLTTADPDKLPARTRQFIDSYFPTTRITVIRIERETPKSTRYEVILENGFLLAFDRRGEWTEVDSQTASVPSGILPSQITSQLRDRFSGRYIVSALRDKNGYAIVLTDGTMLLFDPRGARRPAHR